ncbi:flowering time control protein FCA-like isoform X2 [Ipomoea triloba]|uniref:flowering time control protein FCA-like isoform X2 n=1 Tax=Ipomoea triloba TaxID=35885 RepID=UPI00125E6DCA|nr:flowering time control protein FCA-like isoform X2 [Ipomoea triloba]
MDNRNTGEFAGDHPDFHRNSYCAAPSWPPDESITQNTENHRRNFSGDAHHYQRRQQQQNDHHYSHSDHRHHQNSNLEPNGSVDGAATGNFGNSPPLSGRKRPFSHSQPAPFSDGLEGGGFVKLYAAGVPRTTTEEDVRRAFGEYGHIIEVVLLREKKTGQKQESCFVKYRTLEDADRAIVALHDRFTFPGAECPLKVRYAEGERERLGSFGEHIHKLYVGGMSRQTSKREIDEVFSRYGIVESIYLVRDRDEQKQSRGCAFVQFSRRDMAVSAINALHGTYIMRGCDHPLIVRFADPKKPRLGDSRAAASMGEPFGGHMLPNPASPKQSPGGGSKPQTVSNTCAVLEQVLPSTTSSANKSALDTEMIEFIDCEWSEHVCPDGYLYYYNCETCESRWEKPEEYALYEQEIEKFEEQQNAQPSVTTTPDFSQALKMDVETPLSTEESQKISSTEELNYEHTQMTASPTVPPACV